MIHDIDRISFSRIIFWILSAVTVLALSGCATTPTPPSPETRQQLGRVGVVALPSTPRIEFQTFAKGWATGAAKGGSFGLVSGLLDSLTEISRNPPTGSYAGVATLVALLVRTTISTVVYGVAGGVEAVPGKTSRQIERELNGALGNIDLADNLAENIARVATSRPDLARYYIIRLPPSTSTSLGNLARQEVDNVVELQITETGFRGGSGAQPKVSFYMNARLKLLATNSGAQIYSRDFQYLSRERPFEQWFAAGGKELLTDFRQALPTLADRIIDELFVVTRFPFPSGLWTLPGRTEFGSCWFHPISPALKYSSLWNSIRRNDPGVKILYTGVDSLQPLLLWEEFPRPRDRKAADAAVLKNISNVSYDLKIWEAQSDYPERLIYDISGLPEPLFRPPFSLQPKTRYFWTFRARYVLSGQPQVSRWAFSNIPSKVPTDYPQRPPGGICDFDTIPSTNYFRFITP